MFDARRHEHSGEFAWELTDAGRAFFGATPIDPAGWHLEPVKVDARRAISRAILPGGAVFVKVCRPSSPRALAREVWRGPKARMEFDNLRHLARLGVGALEPLAWGARSRWPGESVLLTREAVGAATLAAALAEPLTPAARQRQARDFGAFVARLHAAGVAHPDPHPGNVLLDAAGRFLLADVHDLRPAGGPLAWNRRRDDLVAWNRYFQARASAADRARFFRTYSEAVPCPAGAARELEAATRASNLRFWARRLKRPWLDNRQTRRVPGGYAARDLAPEELARWLAGPDAVVDSLRSQFWKDSASATVAPVAVRLGDGEVEGVVKRFNRKSWARAAKAALRPSPAARAWALGHNLRDRGLPTPRPLVYLSRRALGLPLVEYVLFERVPDCLELPAAIESAGGRGVLTTWAARVGKLVAEMHAKEVSHRDLKAANVLMSGSGLAATPVLIDLVGAAAGAPVPDGKRRRDLARLAASFARDSRISNGVRLTLLLAYLGPRRGAWKAWWRDLASRVATKESQNRRRDRPLA